jgi:hypothetical protein
MFAKGNMSTRIKSRLYEKLLSAYRSILLEMHFKFCKDLVQYLLPSGITLCRPQISDLTLEKLEFIEQIHLPFQMKSLILSQLQKNQQIPNEKSQLLFSRTDIERPGPTDIRVQTPSLMNQIRLLLVTASENFINCEIS